MLTKSKYNSPLKSQSLSRCWTCGTLVRWAAPPRAWWATAAAAAAAPRAAAAECRRAATISTRPARRAQISGRTAIKDKVEGAQFKAEERILLEKKFGAKKHIFRPPDIRKKKNLDNRRRLTGIWVLHHEQIDRFGDGWGQKLVLGGIAATKYVEILAWY